MKKTILLFIIITGLIACNQNQDNTQATQSRIDSLEKKLADTYKPGFGEFMSGIQVHHAKLWFAGQNQNWKLADFEVGEIKEAIEDIKKYETDRKESQQIDMISPALDSLNNAIQQKNPARFKNSFSLLTSNCNNCHQAVNFEFNKIQIPETPPFSNQNFKPENEK